MFYEFFSQKCLSRFYVHLSDVIQKQLVFILVSVEEENSGYTQVENIRIQGIVKKIQGGVEIPIDIG